MAKRSKEVRALFDETIRLVESDFHRQEFWLRLGNERLLTRVEVPASSFKRMADKILGRIDVLEGNATIACGSAGCAAGWAAVTAAPEDARFSGSAYAMYISDSDLSSGAIRVSTYAMRKLELEDLQASWLFNASLPKANVLWGLRTLRDHPEITAMELDIECPDQAGRVFAPSSDEDE